MRVIYLFLTVFICYLILGCVSTGPLSIVSRATSMYRSARAITQGYYAYNMAKAIKEAEPIFEDYQSVRLEVLLRPRKANALKLVNAFKDNVSYLIKKDIEAVGLNLTVCNNKKECKGRCLILQFKEKGYGNNFATAILVGDRLRGTLYYIDEKTSTVIKEEPMEVAKNYRDLIVEIHTSVASKAIKTIEKQGDEEKVRNAVEKINSIDPIKDEYKDLFYSN